MSQNRQTHKIDRDQVKTLALAVGVREAARQLGLNEKRVLKWSERFHWLQPNPVKLLPPTITNNDVVTVVKPSTALANALADNSKETRLELSKGTRKAAKVFGRMSGAHVIRRSDDLRRIVSSAAQIHNWEEKPNPYSEFNLNMYGNTVVAIQKPGPES